MIIPPRQFVVFLFLVISVVTFGTLASYAAPLTPSASPAALGYTLSDVFDRLTTNVSAVAGAHSFTPTTTPQSTFPTLAQIYDAIPTIYPGDFLASSTYLGITGSIPIKIGDADAVASATSSGKLMLRPSLGYYDGSGSGATVSTTSSAFAPENIKFGTYLFGIVGTLSSATGDAGAEDVFTGKTFSTTTASGATGTLTLACATATFDGTANLVSDSYDGSGDGTDRWCMTGTGDAAAVDIASGKKAWVDGQEVSGTMEAIDFAAQSLQTRDDWVNNVGTTGEYTAEEAQWTAVSGSPFSEYASINFAGTGGDLDLYSGTVMEDTRTGLWWSDVMAVGSSASTTNNAFSAATDGVRPTGGNAIGFCDALNTANFAGYDDWYLPTQKQLMQAYIDGAANNLPNPGFNFWSSTENSGSTANAWRVYLSYGYTVESNKSTNFYYVRCVRP